MAIAPQNPTAVRRRIDELTAAIQAAGLSTGGRRAIDYGEQWTVSGGAERVTLNVYGGKKGVRVVVGGPAGSVLRQTVEAIAGGASGGASPPAAVARAVPVPVAAAFPPGPWVGSDESGKGDYFGPLVAAAAYVRTEEEPALRAAGVRDSKLLDDAMAMKAAAAIRAVCAGRYAEYVLEPERYNALYAEYRQAGRNLNHLLADGHVAVLEQVLTADLPRGSALTVISDQFANEGLVRERLEVAMAARGLPMPTLLQAPRAEANVAVAAASILARDRFLRWLGEASERYGMALPKGASDPAIVTVARELVRRHGVEELGRVVKLHFVTTRRVIQPQL